MIKKIISTTSLLLLLTACNIEYREDPRCEELNYMTFEEFREKGVEVLPSQEIKEAGKIYVYKNTLLIAEKNHGVHVIDNHDKNNPQAKAFLKVPGNIDMAVKDGYLYLDSYMDLVVMDINDLSNIREVNRTNDTFTYYENQNFNGNYYYNDCNFDTSKGVIVGGKK